jgi:hypothetical protein
MRRCPSSWACPSRAARAARPRSTAGAWCSRCAPGWALPLPPDFASGELARDAVHALFLTERPEGWRRGDLTLGGIVLATDAAHAGIHLAGRILHASRRGVVAWSLGHWSANFGALECWEAVDG